MSTVTPPHTAPTGLPKSQARGGVGRKKVSPLALIAGLGIVLLALSAAWRSSHTVRQESTLRIVAAACDLPPGVSIGLMQLKYLDVPKSLVSREMTGSLNDVIGRDTRTYIAAGEPVRQYMVFPAAGGLSRNLAVDERAVTLQLGDDALVDHAIKPDDRVDVLVISAKDTGKFTKTICQLARVLMIAPKEEMLAHHLSAAPMNKVTLAVKPDIAEQITEAFEVGKIRLVLRPKINRTEDLLAGASQDDLLPRSAFPHAVAANAPTPAAASLAAATQALPAPPDSSLAKAGASVPPPPTESPIEWLVQVISGSHRETVSVGQK